MAVLLVSVPQDAFVDELVELGTQALEDRHWLVMSSLYLINEATGVDLKIRPGRRTLRHSLRTPSKCTGSVSLGANPMSDSGRLSVF